MPTNPVSWLQSILGSGVKDILDGAGNIISKFVTDPTQKLQADIELQKISLQGQQLIMDAEAKRLEDVQSARDMYTKDSKIQKIFSMTFLCFYIALTLFVVWIVVGWLGAHPNMQVPEWGQALITTTYGGITAKINTIVDFFFGSSKGSHDKDDTIAQAVANSNTSSNQ